MSVWDVLTYIGVIVVLGGAWYFIKRMDRAAKDKSRENAYRLLEMENPPTKELKRTIRDLNLYGGRLKRDQEFMQLRQKLTRKLDGLEYGSR
jgi:hypothetical protein